MSDEYGSVIQGMFGSGPTTNVAANITADPDQTARAYELEKLTGVPASIIGTGDSLTGFEQNHKARLASDIVASNQHISDYVQSHPLAAQVSNDDYGNLDSLSAKLQEFRKTSIISAPSRIFNAADSAAIKGFAEGFGTEGLGSWLKTEDMRDYPLASAIASVIAAPIEGAIRIGSGAIKAATEATAAGAEEAYTSVGGSPNEAKRFARDMAGIVEMQTTPGAAVQQMIPHVTNGVIAVNRAKPWIEAGKEPPAGLHPLIDQMKLERNEVALKGLDEAVADAQTSLTRERAPELFADFVRQHTQDRQMGISGQKVLEIYGDRVPLPDDGILGWVPDIEQQLAVARETGADVTVPLADWIAKVDPAVAKELHDDLRVAAGGITKREMAERPPIDLPIVDDPIATVRSGAALEPLFSIGDRKLQLQRLMNDKSPEGLAAKAGADWNTISQAERDVYTQSSGRMKEAFADFHDFDLLNEHGQSVGTINLSTQKGGKELYIEMVNGVGEYYNPNTFGPALMRDLLKQLKAEFPEAEVITGHRVSGAREKAGTYNAPSAIPRIRLDQPFDEVLPSAYELFGGQWESRGLGYEVYVKSELQGRAAEIAQAVYSELDRIVPRQVYSEVVESIGYGTREARRTNPRGMYSQYVEDFPNIAIALAFNEDPIGVARHEAIHHLRNYGFLDKTEWATLEKAAVEQGWLERFGIETRYEGKPLELKLEEAVAEGYRDWVAGKEFTPEVTTIFQRIKEMFDRVLAKIQQALGTEQITWEQIFENIDRGEVGSRTGNVPLGKYAYRESSIVANTMETARDKPNEADILSARMRQIQYEMAQHRRAGIDTKTEEFAFARNAIAELRERLAEIEPRLSQPIEGTGLNPDLPFAAAKDVGMTVDQYKKYSKLIEERQQADLKKSVDRVLRDQTKRQTKEWKDQSEAMRPQVVEEYNQRPDVSADKFFGLGELNGTKLDKTYRLDWESLTPEQRAVIPEAYTVRRGGVKADEVAPIFGYQTGAEMIAGIAKITEERKASGLGRERFEREQIKSAIERRMEMEHGLLEKNILEEAHDQIFSENQLDLLHEETHALALMSGEQGFALTKDQLVGAIREKFDALPFRVVSSEKFLKEAGKAGRAAEMGLLSKKPAEAFQAKQVQYFNTVYAQMATALERATAQLDKTAKPYLRNKAPSVEAPFVDHIQRLLQQAGYKVKRSPDELAHSLDFHGVSNLTEFVEHTADQGWDPIISDALKADGAKPRDQMAVADFLDFKDAIDSLNHIGREIRKIEVAGEKMEFAEFKQDVISRITQLPERSRADQDKWMYKIDASLTRMEEMVKDLDLREEAGPLWEAVIHPMVLAKSKEFDLLTDLSKHFQQTKGQFGKKWREALDETIPNDVIWDPYTDTPYDMTKQNLLQIMLNWGNRSNIDKYVAGAGAAKFGKRLSKEEMAAYETQVKALIDTHATADDWAFVRRLWEPFKGWQKDMDTVSRNTTGVAPKWLDIGQVETPFGNFEGGYWPVKYDRLGSNIQAVKESSEHGTDGVFGRNFFRAATSKGYLKTRTGHVDFVDISTSIEQAAATMQQTIHDIAFRDALMQASKVFYDKDIRAAIRKHYGTEYEAQLIPWLKRVSYQFSADDVSLKGFNDFLRRTRMNLVGHALPLNLKVILSPDIGVPNPLTWARFEANRTENAKLAMTHSAEIRHLVYNLDRDYREALNRLTIQQGFGDVQKKALEWGYGPISKISQEFRMATFVDKFNTAKAEGKTDHQASAIADSYVRERHGAASVVDLPAALSSNEAMKMLTIFQGYFNTMYNWQRQIPGNVRRGEWGQAFTNAAGSIGVGTAFGALLFNQRKEDDSWFKIIGKALTLQPLTTVPILSHAANFAFEGFAPRMPLGSLLSAAGSIISDAKKVAKKQPVEKPITHAANIIGLSTGLPLAQIGRTSQFASDVVTGKQRPRNIAEWARGIISGEAKLKK